MICKHENRRGPRRENRGDWDAHTYLCLDCNVRGTEVELEDDRAKRAVERFLHDRGEDGMTFEAFGSIPEEYLGPLLQHVIRARHRRSDARRMTHLIARDMVRRYQYLADETAPAPNPEPKVTFQHLPGYIAPTVVMQVDGETVGIADGLRDLPGEFSIRVDGHATELFSGTGDEIEERMTELYSQRRN